MKIYLPQILSVEEETRHYSVSYEGDQIAGYRVLKAPEFDLTVTHHNNRNLEITGEGCVTLEIPCGRCLTPVETEVPFSLNRKANAGTMKDDEEMDVFFFDSENLLTDPLILDEVIMNVPMKVLCKQDCKGICEKCGANLNDGKCSCDQAEAPTRMAEALSRAFADINLKNQ